MQIEAWGRLTGAMPRPWEVLILRQMDAAWMAMAVDDDASAEPLADEPLSREVFGLWFGGEG